MYDLPVPQDNPVPMIAEMAVAFDELKARVAYLEQRDRYWEQRDADQQNSIVALQDALVSAGILQPLRDASYVLGG